VPTSAANRQQPAPSIAAGSITLRAIVRRFGRPGGTAVDDGTRTRLRRDQSDATFFTHSSKL